MLKLAVATLLLAGVLSATSPTFATGIGAGCTLNPFTHTMRCVQF